MRGQAGLQAKQIGQAELPMGSVPAGTMSVGRSGEAGAHRGKPSGGGRH